jgi:hypothetical protein
VEGIRHVGEAIEAGWEVDSILYAPDLLTSMFARDLIARLGTKAQPVSAPVMVSLADKDNPQGILAVVRQKQARIDELRLSTTPGAQKIRSARRWCPRRTPVMLGQFCARWTRSVRTRSSCSMAAWSYITPQ